MRESLSKALLAEFIGTFALIFVGAGAAALGLGGLLGVALAHGFVVAGFAYTYGHFSGTHINPVVTLALVVAGKVDGLRAISYAVFQIAGGVCGALALRFALGGTETGLGATVLARGLEAGGTTIDVAPTTGLFIEALLTFFLVNAIFNTAVSGKGGKLSGLAIGLTLVFCILVGGPLTGAGLNPARTLGPALATGNFADFWVYIAGPVIGAVAAALLYRGVLSD